MEINKLKILCQQLPLYIFDIFNPTSIWALSLLAQVGKSYTFLTVIVLRDRIHRINQD